MRVSAIWPVLAEPVSPGPIWARRFGLAWSYDSSLSQVALLFPLALSFRMPFSFRIYFPSYSFFENGRCPIPHCVRSRRGILGHLSCDPPVGRTHSRAFVPGQVAHGLGE